MLRVRRRKEEEGEGREGRKEKGWKGGERVREERGRERKSLVDRSSVKFVER